MDTIDPARRSRNMAKIRGKNTGPERLLRSILHRMGYRFRLHDAKLPGKPDIVLPRRKAVIFAHGCFWHGHEGCGRAALPATRTDFWAAKIEGNVRHDARVLAALKALGYRCLVIWQCEMKDGEALRRRLRDFLEEGAPGERRAQAPPSGL
jgi:DNA mismatch endonuclease (patch repair protein)